MRRAHWAQVSAGSPLCSNPAGSFLIPDIRLPSGRHPEQGLWCRLRASLHAEFRLLPRGARVPPKFSAPAPSVRSPSGRRSGCALSCSALRKTRGSSKRQRQGGLRPMAESKAKPLTTPRGRQNEPSTAPTTKERSLRYGPRPISIH